MAATTTLLGLLTPTQGTLSGTWGDSVNYGISDYVDIAIAGTLSFAGDGAITLANTTGSASGNGFTTTTAQYMVIRITGTQTVTKVITGPSYSKLYMVDHAGATSAVTFKASGQTGVSIAVGEKCFVYYNGTDYVKIATSATTTGTVTSVAASVPSIFSIAGSPITTSGTLAMTYSGTALPIANGGTGLTTTPANGALDIGNGTGFTRTTLTAGTAISVTNGAGSISIANTGVTSNVAGTGISVSGATGAVTITNSGVTSAVAGTGVTVSGATGAVTFSIGQAVATSSNVQFNSLGVGTAGSGTAGEIRATNNVTAYYSSDIKFKENVRDIPDALATVNSIGGKLFDWKDSYIADHGGADGYFVRKADFGVVAQDVQKVFPIAVRTREDGSLAVDYEKLGALAFAALVELTKRVEALEAK